MVLVPSLREINVDEIVRAVLQFGFVLLQLRNSSFESEILKMACILKIILYNIDIFIPFICECDLTIAEYDESVSKLNR